MCDQTEVTYDDGDVVWVKIGSIWWPGVVKDLEKNEEDREVLEGLKKKPIAAVKFFEEESYEFVKNLENIYHYNCRKKDEFIKKGLDKFRTGASHMVKFPDDVTRAEILVNGNPDIINDPKFARQEKTNYNDVFGSAKNKKTTKKTEETPPHLARLLPSKGHSVPTPNRPITHERFIRKIKDGTSDYRAVILSPGNASSPQSTDSYNCPFCEFITGRLQNVATHVKYSHSPRRSVTASSGYTSSTPSRGNAQMRKTKNQKGILKRKGRVNKPKVSTFDTPSTPQPEETPLKRPAETPEKNSEKKKRFTDALLADWSEDEDMRDDTMNDECRTDLNENVAAAENSEPTVASSPPSANLAVSETNVEEEPPSSAQSKEPEDKKETTSCFDFDEEDDGFIGMSNANTYGRKIPRVIPVKDKTDLGMDLEVDELFKRKSAGDGSNEDGREDDASVAPPPKKRGRRPKNLATPESVKVEPKKELIKPAASTLASTRSRRPGARKSYLNQVITAVTDEPVIQPKEEDEPQKPPSRRKQDLKKQSLLELDDLDLVNPNKFKSDNILDEGSVGLKTGSPLRKKKLSQSGDQKDDLSAKLESLLAETAAPQLPTLPKGVSKELDLDDDEEENGTVEYLEEERDSKQEEEESSTLVKSQWKDHLQKQLDGESKKAIQAQWKQDVKGSLEDEEADMVPPKDIIVGGNTKSESATTKIISLGNIKNQTIRQQKGCIVLKKQWCGSRPKILSKSSGQQVMLLTKPRTGPKVATSSYGVQKRVQVLTASTSKASLPGSTQPVVQVLAEGGVKKLLSPKKLIQIGGKNSPQKLVLSSKAEGIRLINNYNGSGKTVIIKEAGSSLGSKTSGYVLTTQPVIGVRKSQQLVDISSDKQTSCIIKRIKGPDGKFTIQPIVKSVRVGGETRFVIPAQHRTASQRQATDSIKVSPETAEPEPEVELDQEPEIEEVPTPDPEEPLKAPDQLPTADQPVLATQVVAMPGPPASDGQPTFVLVSFDEHGMVHTLDGSLVTQPEDSGVLLVNSSEEASASASSTNQGQDILAEALANTNVLDNDPPMSTLIMPQVDNITKPILTSLVVSPTILPDTSAMIMAPVVQETSVTLQKPIMTPVEVPTAVVPDTSGLEPPPLPPTPTEEDVLMEESDGGLMIEEQQTDESAMPEVQERVGRPDSGDFFIDDSQEGEEATSFQSMPLLNEESTASEEPIGDQNFEIQGTRLEEPSAEFMPTSTNDELETENQEPEETINRRLTIEESVYCEEDPKNGETEPEGPQSMPFISDEPDVQTRPQDTEVSSTTIEEKPETSV